MKIVQITENEKGSMPPLQDWPGDVPPAGYAAFPEKFFPIFYPADKKCAGFVDITVEGGTVTACTWNEEAYQAYIAGLQEPEPEGPTAQDDTDAMLVDCTYRITMLELCLTE